MKTGAQIIEEYTKTTTLGGDGHALLGEMFDIAMREAVNEVLDMVEKFSDGNFSIHSILSNLRETYHD